MMKSIFESIAYLFENILFIPYNFLRTLSLDTWWGGNVVSCFFILIGFVAIIYWIKQLIKYEKEEDKTSSSHSFLN